MFPDLTGKKVYTEDGKEIGYISEIRPDEFGSFVAVVNTKYNEFPKFEVPVTMLRRKVIGSSEVYTVRTIPFKLKMILESEMAKAKEEKPVIEIPKAPEVPPLEKFTQKEEEKEEMKETIAELEEKEEIGKEIKEPSIEEEKREGEVERKGFFSRIISIIISMFKKIFKK